MKGPIDAKLREIQAVVFPIRLSRSKLLLLGEFDRVEAEDGRSIARKGETAKWVYVVLSGRVDEVAASGPCRRCGPGDVVGDAAVLAQGPWPRSAVAVGRTRLLAIPASRFAELLVDVPELGGAVMQSLSRRLVAAEKGRTMRRHHYPRIAPA